MEGVIDCHMTMVVVLTPAIGEAIGGKLGNFRLTVMQAYG